MQLVPVGLSLGIVLTLGGVGVLAFGAYTLARGGRNGNEGGLGGFSERDIHAIAGFRIVAGGVVALILGVIFLWSYFSG